MNEQPVAFPGQFTVAHLAKSGHPPDHPDRAPRSIARSANRYANLPGSPQPAWSRCCGELPTVRVQFELLRSFDRTPLDTKDEWLL